MFGVVLSFSMGICTVEDKIIHLRQTIYSSLNCIKVYDKGEINLSEICICKIISEILSVFALMVKQFILEVRHDKGNGVCWGVR